MRKKPILSQQEKWEIIKAHHIPILITLIFCLLLLPKNLIVTAIFAIPAIFLSAFFPIPYYFLFALNCLSTTDPRERARLLLRFRNDLPYVLISIIRINFNDVDDYIYGFGVYIGACFSLAKILEFIFKPKQNR